MHNFVYLAQWRSQEFSCEPNFGGGGAPPLAAPVAHLYVTVQCQSVCPVGRQQQLLVCCRSGGRYRGTAAGGAYWLSVDICRPPAAGSVMLRAEVRGSAQSCFVLEAS